MSTPELSRPIKVRPLPGEPVRIEADAAERAALASRFGLAGIDLLKAEIELENSSKSIRAKGTLLADFQQHCAISGEPFPVQFKDAVDLRFVEESRFDIDNSEEVEIELEADDCDEIEYSGDTFDLGEAIAQTLGLVIDPYAEGPNADEARKAAGITQEGEQTGPLAEALAALKKD